MPDGLTSDEHFPPTRWSLVIEHSDTALEELCQIYWQPIYAFARRFGMKAEDAEDLTQSFLASVADQETFFKADESKGRMRSFLIGAFKRHLNAWQKHEYRQKRGGGIKPLSLDVSKDNFGREELAYLSLSEFSDETAPDKLFDQRWAIELLNRTHCRLRRDYDAQGKLSEYEALKHAVATTRDIEPRDTAAELGVAKSTVRVLAHRLRKNFRAAFKEEIIETVQSREEAEEEFQYLLTIFS